MPTTIKIYGTYIRFKNQTTKLNIGNTEGKGLQLRFWRIGKLRTANADSWIQLMRKWTDNLNYYGSGIFLEKTETILRLNNCKMQLDIDVKKFEKSTILSFEHHS